MTSSSSVDPTKGEQVFFELMKGKLYVMLSAKTTNSLICDHVQRPALQRTVLQNMKWIAGMLYSIVA